MDFIGASCSVCRTWTVCRAPLPQRVYCGVCDPNPPPPPRMPEFTENQLTEFARMLQDRQDARLNEPEPDSDSDSEWNSETCEDNLHDVDEYCPTCGHRSECARCGDDAVGNYGEHLDALCDDCRDDEGFCDCGDLRAECGCADE